MSSSSIGDECIVCQDRLKSRHTLFIPLRELNRLVRKQRRLHKSVAKCCKENFFRTFFISHYPFTEANTHIIHLQVSFVNKAPVIKAIIISQCFSPTPPKYFLYVFYGEDGVPNVNGQIIRDAMLANYLYNLEDVDLMCKF